METVIAGLRGYERLAGSPWRRRGKHRFLLGESLSLADIWAGHVLYRYFTLDLPQDVPAGLREYYDDLCSNPNYATHVMVDYSELKARTAVLSRKADITLAACESDLGRGRRTRRRQPVGGQPRLHARRLGLRQDGGEGQTRAAELGYRPNILARAMVSGRSRMIGLVVAYLDNQFYPDVLERLSNALQQRGYHVLVFMASQTAGNIDTVVEEILDYQVDGIIAASVALSSDLSDRCRAAGCRWCCSTGRRMVRGFPR
jgi:hypothetical protein